MNDPRLTGYVDPVLQLQDMQDALVRAVARYDPSPPARLRSVASLYDAIEAATRAHFGLGKSPTAMAVAQSDRYPHACPRCAGPAYIGATEVDCQAGCK